MGFYVTLPSNASSLSFPENNPSRFKVRLAKNLFMLENDWEVALANISFPDLVSGNGKQEEYGNHDLKTRIPIIMNFKMFCKVLSADGTEIPVTRNGNQLKDKDGNTLYIHYVHGPVRLDLEERGVSFSRSIKNGTSFGDI